MARARQSSNAKGDNLGTYLWIWCPGCEEAHTAIVPDERGAPVGRADFWSWNHDLENLTIGGSILVNAGRAHPAMHVCHSFVEDGQIRFLGDSTHALANKTVPLPPLPDWLVR